MSAAPIGHNQPPPVPEFVEFDERLAKLSERYGGAEYNLDVPNEFDRAKRARLALGREIAGLDRVHQVLKGPLLEKTRVIDGERKRIKDAMLVLQNAIKEQITAREKRAADRAEALNDRVLAIRGIGELPAYPGSALVSDRIDQVETIDISDFEERKPSAALAKTETIDYLRGLLASEQRREGDAAEAELARQEASKREREAREEAIRKEAAEGARRQAEAAAAEQIEAERAAKIEAERAAKKAHDDAVSAEARRLAQAVADRANAEKFAKDAAERAARDERERIEKDQRETEAKAKAKLDAETARKAKQAHRAKIHKGAQSSLIGGGIPEEMATLAIELIKGGKVAHVYLEY